MIPNSKNTWGKEHKLFFGLKHLLNEAYINESTDLQASDHSNLIYLQFIIRR